MKKLIGAIIICLFSLQLAAQDFSTKKSLAEFRSDFQDRIVSSEINYPVQDTFEKKKTGLAIIYSLLLPGMGELYAGDYSSGKYFTIADGLIWGTVAGFTIHANNKEDDYMSMAKAFAGADVSGKDEDYFTNIGLYLDTEEYNRAMLIKGKFDVLYDDDSFNWKWDGNDRRSEYRNLWKSAETATNNIRFAVGALILNRIVSAINAARIVRAYNKKVDEVVSWNVSLNLLHHRKFSDGVELNFRSSF